MTRSRKPRRRGLAEAEQALWSKAMADVKPLRRKRRVRKAATSIATPPIVHESPPRDAAHARREASRAPPPALQPTAPVLGIDKNTLAKLKRGDMEISGRLDLHGMTQLHAHAELDAFLGRAVARNERLLLVITGKGIGGDGVLRRQLPHWIHASAHAARVLRIEPAHLRHGGSGAWYVFLRRRRDRE